MVTKTYKKEKDHGTDISFENEVKKMNEGLKKHKDLDFSGLENQYSSTLLKGNFQFKPGLYIPGLSFPKLLIV